MCKEGVTRDWQWRVNIHMDEKGSPSTSIAYGLVASHIQLEMEWKMSFLQIRRDEPVWCVLIAKDCNANFYFF